MNNPGKEEITEWLQSLQDRICRGLEEFDGVGKFHEDKWERPGGGGGRSRVITDGKVIAKGGVNFSAVHGETPEALSSFLGRKDSTEFFATGVSIVLHSVNPWVPIIHMNVRYFEVDDDTWWFGGGIDLTPHYIIPSVAAEFHKKLKAACDRFDPDYYPEFKKWADDYFYIPHRHETRGVGGVFFDRLGPSGKKTKQELFDFLKAVGETFLSAYIDAAKEGMNKEYSEKELSWQRIRRGRYVEFNLVYDRGTRFGLETSGRIESILMSLPPLAEWQYNYQPEKESLEYQTLTKLKKDINWIDEL